MTTYSELLSSVWQRSLLSEPDPIPNLTELDLQALWFSGALGRDFVDQFGDPVHIVQFGFWNRQAGPDFLHAAIRHRDTLRTGAIEIHLRTRDWETHGHHLDPAYDPTILHVVLDHPSPARFTRTSRHREVPSVTLSLDSVRSALRETITPPATAQPGRCVASLRQLSPPERARLLQEAFLHRIRRKSLRLARLREAHSPDVALWVGIAETLGYSANRQPMRCLALRLSPREIRRAPAPPETILLGAAGFLQPSPPPPEDSAAHHRCHWDLWWKVRPHYESARLLPWKFHGQRPANHPHRRVAALAALISCWPRFRRLTAASEASPLPAFGFFEKLHHPFWSHHHSLLSQRSASPIALVGPSFVREWLVNHLLPALHLDTGLPPWAFTLRGNPPNQNLRRAAIRLFGSAAHARPYLQTAAHQQAILQIYHDFCLADATSCSHCPFPEQLTRCFSSHPAPPSLPPA